MPPRSVWQASLPCYQSGYVTIKDADTDFGIYRLDIPNKEVRIGLMRSLLPYMSHPTR